MPGVNPTIMSKNSSVPTEVHVPYEQKANIVMILAHWFMEVPLVYMYLNFVA